MVCGGCSGFGRLCSGFGRLCSTSLCMFMSFPCSISPNSIHFELEKILNKS